MENCVAKYSYPAKYAYLRHGMGYRRRTAASLFTCVICFETLPGSKKFETGDCSHIHHFCTDCITQYIEVKTSDGGASKIKCPHFGCSFNLDVLACRSFLPPELFVKWCDLLCETEILTKFVERQAYCPNCYELVLNECGSVTRQATCPGCKKSFCFHCMVPWQKSHYCTRSPYEVMIRDKNDLLFMETVARKGWTRCPTCKCYVQRRAGCSVIRCRCSTKFCYECGSKAYSNSCPCGVRRRREMTPMTPEELRNFKIFISLMLLGAVAIALLIHIL